MLWADNVSVEGQEGVEESSRAEDRVSQLHVICFNSGCADFIYDHHDGFRYGDRNVIFEDPFSRQTESSTHTGRVRSPDSLYMHERTAGASTTFSVDPVGDNLERSQLLAEVGAGVGELPQSLTIFPLQLSPVFLIPTNANLPLVTDETNTIQGTVYPPQIAAEDIDWEYVS
jgi:hypothetical protein